MAASKTGCSLCTLASLVDFEIWCDEQIDAIIRGHTAPDDERIKAIFCLAIRLRGKAFLMTRCMTYHSE